VKTKKEELIIRKYSRKLWINLILS